jgi:hypothetical protein
MTILQTRYNAGDPESIANRAAMQAQVDDLRALVARLSRGRRRQGAGATPGPRQAAAPAAARRPARPGHAVSRALAARGLRGLRRRGARRRADHRHRPGQRPRVHDVYQRRHGQRRHLLPADGEEAGSGRRPSRSRTTCPASTSSTPAAPSCHCRTKCSRTGALRPRLLQPGAHVREGHPAARRGARLLHRRRRLSAGHGRRVDHRARAGHDLSRRSAAGKSGHRRGGRAPRSRRRRRALPLVRRHRSLRRATTPTPWPARASSPPQPARPWPSTAEPRPPRYRPRTCTASFPRIAASPSTSAR